MNAKLTLKLDSAVIGKAKSYAAKRKESLSKLVENYFRTLATYKHKNEELEITPIVKYLSGIIKEKDYKKAKDSYTDYLLKKYG